MSHMIEQKHELDEATSKSYNALYRKLGGLIEYVASQLPEGRQEVLCESSLKLGGGIIPDIEEGYMLSREGAFEIVKNVYDKKKTDASMKSVNPVFMVVGVSHDKFDKICENLQKIIDKYGIEIPERFT
jgi:hypothetical protein